MKRYAQLPFKVAALLNLSLGNIEFRYNLAPLSNPSYEVPIWREAKVIKRFYLLRKMKPKHFKEYLIKHHTPLLTHLFYPTRVRELHLKLRNIKHLWVITNDKVTYYDLSRVRRLPINIVRRGVFGRNYAVVFY